MEALDDDLQIDGEIGKGCWSVVRLGYMKSLGLRVAVKVETIESGASLLIREAKIMQHLQDIQGVPTLYKSGTNGTYNFIAMQKLHCTLDVLRKQGLLKAEDVLTRANQLLDTMEEIHKRGIIHQDLQPKNLMTADDYSSTYYIDFGLATSIANQKRKGPRDIGILGTPSFSSNSALLGIEQDRKDDLESLGYNLVWLICGKLPWESYAKEGNLGSLKSAKGRTPVSSICQGCPDEFIHYFNYVKGLQFRDMPDYQFLRGLIECAKNKLNQVFKLPENFSPRPRLRNMSEDINIRKDREASKKMLSVLTRTHLTQFSTGKSNSKDNKPFVRKKAPKIIILGDSPATLKESEGLTPMAKSLHLQAIPKSPLLINRGEFTPVIHSKEFNKLSFEASSQLKHHSHGIRKLSTQLEKPNQELAHSATSTLGTTSYRRDNSQATTLSSPAQLEANEPDFLRSPTIMPKSRFPKFSAELRQTIAELKIHSSGSSSTSQSPRLDFKQSPHLGESPQLALTPHNISTEDPSSQSSSDKCCIS